MSLFMKLVGLSLGLVTLSGVIIWVAWFFEERGR